ncbi:MULTISPECIES: hypothetical protein [Lactiplantibacillus]|nr:MULTISPECIES: hypothetical protein [Lactiplantibacillus]AUI77876.1 hypothetical protein BB562_03785 [Lactiplantibacillus pentosus]AYJ42768.1 hypothetical protein LP314_13215 [Lactiplantibacillus pentosus]MBU7462667.1 hypothetical protein [Lactiplantibacillus pentosus]MBU7478225.1 hypothetical protein [Lactiplantibacillus pentosus]MBU7485335.1 hypothetical protein [Lactiplantibacillus sp. 30.2.29]
MQWRSFWRHTRTIVETLLIYFLLIQGPYDLWIGKTGYQIGSYLIDIVGITVLFMVVELGYNAIRQHVLKRRSQKK